MKKLTQVAQAADEFKKWRGAHPDLSIGVWFNRAAGGHVGSFHGIKVTMRGSAGEHARATYSKAQTYQF